MRCSRGADAGSTAGNQRMAPLEPFAFHRFGIGRCVRRWQGTGVKLAVLETGRPPGDLADRFGDYPSMFEQLLGDGFEIERFDVQAGELPDAGAHDAVLITGSPAGVYDGFPWIVDLSDFIRAARDSKMVGICFGHQVMAEALGGHVEKSERGWAQVCIIIRSTGPHRGWMAPTRLPRPHRIRTRSSCNRPVPRWWPRPISRLSRDWPGPIDRQFPFSSTPSSRPLSSRR